MLTGGSTPVAAFELSLRAVLGDSLPASRYRLTARLNGSGWASGKPRRNVFSQGELTSMAGGAR
jgi:hypothetical protein